MWRLENFELSKVSEESEVRKDRGVGKSMAVPKFFLNFVDMASDIC